MTTSPIIKLTCGTRALDLTTGRYRVDDDFVPPPYAMTPLIAYGTSANKSGGALVDTKPQDKQWVFGIHISGSSDSEVRRAVADLQAFLSMAGDESTPLYLEHKQNSDTPEPLWGNYGTNIKYEILTGTARISDLWAVSDLRARGLPACQVTLLVKPRALGLRQRLGSATGRIVEDVYGAADGVSKGLHISPSITNKMTNPVFGSSMWSTGWTADASLTASQNTDARFVLPGAVNSAKLFARATGQEFYQSITLTVATYLFEALIMLPDLGTPSSSDVELYYNATLTTTFASLGNGLWRLSAFATGQAAPINTGVQVKNGRGIYLLYYGCTDSSLSHLPIIGDNLGCAWSGAAHGSTSTSTAGRWRQVVAADTFDYQQGAVRIVWTPNMAYSNYGAGSYRIWDAGSLYINFDATNDRFLLWDGTNGPTVNTTFAADTPIVIHAVWGPSGLYLYVNGVSATTAYTPPAAASYFYLGSDSTPANYCGGVFGDLTVWGVALTATQAANDYANVAQLTADNQRVGCIPWLWTKDGDDVVDNCDDSTRDNWAVCGGIPGSAEAITEITGNGISVDTYISHLVVNNFALPGAFLFFDQSGTATTSADVGSAVLTTSAGTTAVQIAVATLALDKLIPLLGKEVHGFVRMRDAGSNLRLRIEIGAPYPIAGEYASAVSSATTLLNRCPPINFYSESVVDKLSAPSATNVTFQIRGYRTSGGASDIAVDFFMLVPSPNVLFVPANTGWTYKSTDDFVASYLYSTSELSSISGVIGGKISLHPDKQNILIFVQAQPDIWSISATLVIGVLRITPRYQLL